LSKIDDLMSTEIHTFSKIEEYRQQKPTSDSHHLRSAEQDSATTA